MAISIRYIMILMVCTVFAISGCATLDKNECLNADWRTIGYEDGTRGYAGSYIRNHRKACAEYGVAPNLDLYEEGRQMGLRQYCTPRNGYRLGSSGKRYSGTCPADLDPAFRHAIQEGQKLYALEREAQNQKRAIDQAYKDLETLEIEIDATEADLIRPKVSPHRRKALLDELRMLEDGYEALSMEVYEMEKTLDHMERRLARIRKQSPYQ